MVKKLTRNAQEMVNVLLWMIKFKKPLKEYTLNSIKKLISKIGVESAYAILSFLENIVSILLEIKNVLIIMNSIIY